MVVPRIYMLRCWKNKIHLQPCAQRATAHLTGFNGILTSIAQPYRTKHSCRPSRKKWYFFSNSSMSYENIGLRRGNLTWSRHHTRLIFTLLWHKFVPTGFRVKATIYRNLKLNELRLRISRMFKVLVRTLDELWIHEDGFGVKRTQYMFDSPLWFHSRSLKRLWVCPYSHCRGNTRSLSNNYLISCQGASRKLTINSPLEFSRLARVRYSLVSIIIIFVGINIYVYI